MIVADKKSQVTNGLSSLFYGGNKKISGGKWSSLFIVDDKKAR
jgi:hypothetical protein